MVFSVDIFIFRKPSPLLLRDSGKRGELQILGGGDLEAGSQAGLGCGLLSLLCLQSMS